ncbi:MAG: PilZ domain-containing protein [Phycisphaerae bacterium]
MSNVLFEQVEKELQGSEVISLLSHSVAESLPVSITWMLATEVRSLQGRFIEVNGSCAHIELEEDIDHHELPEAHAEAQIDFQAEGARYSFSCWGFDIDASGHRAITIAVPSSVHSVERRRSPRLTLRSNCHVTIAPDAWPQDGRIQSSMLNLSLHGLAASVGERPEWMQQNAMVSVHFSSEVGLPDFKLRAFIVSVTDAGEEGRSIVGMEFTEDAAYAALLPALRQVVEE